MGNCQEPGAETLRRRPPPCSEELAELQEKVGQMSEEELKAFRNSMNPDDMGFFGEESVDDGSTKD